MPEARERISELIKKYEKVVANCVGIFVDKSVPQATRDASWTVYGCTKSFIDDLYNLLGDEG